MREASNPFGVQLVGVHMCEIRSVNNISVATAMELVSTAQGQREQKERHGRVEWFNICDASAGGWSRGCKVVALFDRQER